MFRWSRWGSNPAHIRVIWPTLTAGIRNAITTIVSSVTASHSSELVPEPFQNHFFDVEQVYTIRLKAG